jgi:hypothetical protein
MPVAFSSQLLLTQIVESITWIVNNVEIQSQSLAQFYNHINGNMGKRVIVNIMIILNFPL